MSYKTIDRDDLKRKMDNNDDFVLVDLLEKEKFEKEHIKGAVNIPLEEIGHTMKERYPLDKEIVVYCSNIDCQASPTAAKKLDQLGFENVFDYERGKADWKEAGFPME